MDHRRDEGTSSHRRRDSDGGELPKLYKIFKGEIASVQAYGIFVKIPGFNKQGLVHKSQMSSTRIENPEEIVEKGESVYCKVINIDKETGKVALSMKVVNQASGEDRDPNQIQTSLDDQRRRTGVKRGHDAIQLGAIYDTTCRKCGGRGHLAQDCFGKKDGPVYELLPDEEEKDDGAVKKAKKKKKKKKKNKHKHKDDSDDSGSDSDSDTHKKHHKKKKKKKHKKQHSSSDSDSDSGRDDHVKKERRHSHSERHHESKDERQHQRRHSGHHRRDSSSDEDTSHKHHKRRRSHSESDTSHKHKRKSKS